jgi:hypothetical protein
VDAQEEISYAIHPKEIFQFNLRLREIGQQICCQAAALLSLSLIVFSEPGDEIDLNCFLTKQCVHGCAIKSGKFL